MGVMDVDGLAFGGGGGPAVRCRPLGRIVAMVRGPGGRSLTGESRSVVVKPKEVAAFVGETPLPLVWFSSAGGSSVAVDDCKWVSVTIVIARGVFARAEPLGACEGPETRGLAATAVACEGGVD